MAWFTREINITHDTRLALTTEAAGALSNSGIEPHLRHLLEWVLEAQANKCRRGHRRSRWTLSWNLGEIVTWGDQVPVNKARTLFSKVVFIP